MLNEATDIIFHDARCSVEHEARFINCRAIVNRFIKHITKYMADKDPGDLIRINRECGSKK